MGEHLDTFNREEVLHNRHIQPKESIFDNIKIENTNDGSILPSVKLLDEELEQRDCSRFAFAVEDEIADDLPETPEHI